MNPLPPKIVLITGGYRTGSTLVYNLAREIMEATGIGGRPICLGAQPAEVDAVLRLPPCFFRDWYLVKVHNYWTAGLPRAVDGTVRVIHTRRDPLAARESLARIRGGAADDPEVVRSIGQADEVTHLYDWQSGQTLLAGTSPLIFDFEKLFDLPQVIRIIATHLGAELHSHQVERIAERWAVDRVRREACALVDADPVTELRPGHVTRGLPDP